MLKMEQQIDALSGPQSKRYMHNYEMPPYSTGETGRVGSPKRREIGHGALAEKALVPVLPSREEFPYAIRQVSEQSAPTVPPPWVPSAPPRCPCSPLAFR